MEKSVDFRHIFCGLSVMLLCTVASCVQTSCFLVEQTIILHHLWCISKAERAAIHKIHQHAVVLIC